MNEMNNEMNNEITSFRPIWNAESRILILGSMPGAESLRQQQYYAHPRNVFWPIIGKLCRFSAALPYEERLRQLLDKRIALWDSARRCCRKGSLDAAIRNHELNDFAWLFDAAPKIELVCFNGRKAEQLFKEYVRGGGTGLDNKHFLALPSTSPANAAMTFEQKLECWRQLNTVL